MSDTFAELDKILNVAENAVIEREKPPKIEPRKSDDELDTDYQYAKLEMPYKKVEPQPVTQEAVAEVTDEDIPF